MMRTRPSQMVVSQLNVLIAEGTAMAMETAMNDPFTRGSTAETNMWWAHTPKERTPMASVE